MCCIGGIEETANGGGAQGKDIALVGDGKECGGGTRIGRRSDGKERGGDDGGVGGGGGKDGQGGVGRGGAKAQCAQARVPGQGGGAALAKTHRGRSVEPLEEGERGGGGVGVGAEVVGRGPVVAEGGIVTPRHRRHHCPAAQRLEQRSPDVGDRKVGRGSTLCKEVGRRGGRGKEVGGGCVGEQCVP